MELIVTPAEAAQEQDAPAPIQEQDLADIAHVTTMQEHVINRFIKRTMSIVPAKEHKEFGAELRRWIVEMKPQELFVFCMEYSRCGQKKELDFSRLVYGNFKNKKLHEAGEVKHG